MLDDSTQLQEYSLKKCDIENELISTRDENGNSRPAGERSPACSLLPLSEMCEKWCIRKVSGSRSNESNGKMRFVDVKVSWKCKRSRIPHLPNQMPNKRWLFNKTEPAHTNTIMRLQQLTRWRLTSWLQSQSPTKLCTMQLFVNGERFFPLKYWKRRTNEWSDRMHYVVVAGGWWNFE